MAMLNETEIIAEQENVPKWERIGNEIVRTYELDDFPAAISFVGRVAELSEAANHHPDIDIRYRKVRIALTTHDAGGLTKLDFSLAQEIDQAL
ncbi:putative pterin-4-alpha-carbinolamine dehydratase [Actinomycetes bacterium]|nr:putative pterin-4-alpha-carbinolamine dehydratase [Actinomycetes bacterium]